MQDLYHQPVGCGHYLLGPLLSEGLPGIIAGFWCFRKGGLFMEGGKRCFSAAIRLFVEQVRFQGPGPER